jgi:hypothetical protein
MGCLNSIYFDRLVEIIIDVISTPLDLQSICTKSNQRVEIQCSEVDCYYLYHRLLSRHPDFRSKQTTGERGFASKIFMICTQGPEDGMVIKVFTPCV